VSCRGPKSERGNPESEEEVRTKLFLSLLGTHCFSFIGCQRLPPTRTSSVRLFLLPLLLERKDKEKEGRDEKRTKKDQRTDKERKRKERSLSLLFVSAGSFLSSLFF
jgi:hypothetical protein